MRDRGTTDIAAAVRGIRGWTTVEEAHALYRAVLLASDRFGAPTVVEIGSFEGRSTVALAKAVQEAGAGKVFAIDPHGEELDHFAEFQDNMRRAGVDDVVEPLRMTSEEARWRFEEGSVHVLFVDGSHDYQVVSRDLFDWTPALADGAIAAFNDPFWPGVNRALRERVAYAGSPFRRPAFVSNSLFFEFHPGRRWFEADARAHRRLRALLAVGRPLRGPHRVLEAHRRAPQWYRHAEGSLIDGLLNRLVPPDAAGRGDEHPDATLVVQALVQGAIRGHAGRTAEFTSADFRLSVRATEETRSTRGDEARALLARIAERVLGPAEDPVWSGAQFGSRVDVGFRGSLAGRAISLTMRAELEEDRVHILDIETDADLAALIG